MSNKVELIRKLFENKKVLILGYGREGKSTHSFIVSNNVNSNITIADKRNLDNELIDNNVTVLNIEECMKHLNEYDIIMKSPGISLKDINIEDLKDKIYSQSKIALEFFKNQIIGITGTKGKSTTTSLIYTLLNKVKGNTVLCGNIGLSFFDRLENIDDETNIVYEFSCHQLEYINDSPKIAIITNIYEEHLDYYKSFLHYINAKLNITRYQQEDDILICDIDNEHISNYINNNKVKSYIYDLSKIKNTMFHMKHETIYENNKIIFDNNNERNIIGDHNLFDIMILFVIAKIYNIEYKDVYNVIKKFKGLEHRLEYVCDIKGVKFYNDSISTIPETCIAALDSLKEVDTLIIGGKDRGINYNNLINKINSLENLKVICINDVGSIIYDKINNEKYKIDDMSLIADKAVEITKKICLLSPAASSYGFYKNFEERGNRFKEEILKRK